MWRPRKHVNVLHDLPKICSIVSNWGGFVLLTRFLRRSGHLKTIWHLRGSDLPGQKAPNGMNTAESVLHAG